MALERRSKKYHYKMSAAALRALIAQEMPRNEIVSDDEMRKLLRALAFSLANLHSDHYFKIAQRLDVVHHRSCFAPFYLSIQESPRVWWIAGDASFFHENSHSELAWVPLDVPNADMIPCRVGAGQRLNVWEFVTKEGILRHPDGAPFELVFRSSDRCSGNSAGTVYPPNTTQTADDMFVTFQRGIEAIRADSRFDTTIPVLIIDGAKINKTFPVDVIWPENVHYLLLCFRW